MYNELRHHGILGMKWGQRRFQNSDGSLTKAGKARYNNGLSKQDNKWIAKNSDKIMKKTQKSVSKEMSKYDTELLKSAGSRMVTTRGKLSASVVNAHNRKLAELMNTKVSDLSSPSGKAVKFVAKRGEMGVMMALADKGYNMAQIKNGVYSTGKVAYKKTVLDKA